MVFSTPQFLLAFLPAVWLVFCFLALYATPRFLLAWLGLASLVFYSAWDINLLPLLLTSIAINYWLAGRVTRRSPVWLWLGLAFNLGLLVWFKYSVFFLSMAHFPPLAISPVVLPLGISFFTFQQIAFLVDVRQKKIERGPLTLYGVFVSFFPQLIAGPIVHYRELAPQLGNLGLPNQAALRCGLLLLSIGLAKKILLADQLAPYVDQLYAQPAESFVAGDTLLAGWSYGLQLYFDFSGYADMAIGIALLFGIRLPDNFRSPYQARDIQDFWRRWHITLSQFLRDYLYVPLGGSRHGLPRHLVALLATMLLGGLWHGAGWTFLFWGGLHGVCLAALVLWRRISAIRMPGAMAWMLTLGFIMLAWIPFRADGMHQTWLIYAGLGHWQWGALGDAYHSLNEGIMALRAPVFMVFLASLIALALPNSASYARWLGTPSRIFWQGALTGALLLAVAKAMVDLPSQAFLYFNF